METQRVTAEQIQAELQADLKALAERMAEAINNARAGHIIDDSEEPVRDAHAAFRQQAYQRALDLLHRRPEAFSP